MSVLFTDMLDYWRRNAPQKPALIFNEETLTYEAFCRWTDGVAAELRSKGLVPGDVINIIGDNSLEWLAAAIGAIKAGVVVAGINQRSVATEIADLVGRCGGRMIFTDAAHRQVVVEALAETVPILQLEDLRAHQDGQPWESPRVSPDSPLVLVFTSGTTSKSKAVIQTHRTWLSTAIERQLVEPAFSRDMRQLFVLSLFGNGGTVSGSLNVLAHGGTFIVEPRFDAARALELIQRHEVTVFAGPPIIFEQIAALPAFGSARIDTLASCMVGGAPVPQALLETWRAKGVRLRQLYGQTELGIVVTVSTDEEVDAGARSCGRGGIFTKLRIARADGSTCAPGEAGEIRAFGPSCTVGYWGDPEATRALFDEQGWLKTGDIGVMDETGLLTFVDRAKEIIISGGFNISPAEVEAAILRVPGVKEAAVLPAFDAKFGETPLAVVYGEPGLCPDVIVEACNAALSNYKVPRYVDIVGEPLPRMTSQKVNKRLLREIYADAHERLPKLR
jgi:fatty-acyl-CoA synthase